MSNGDLSMKELEQSKKPHPFAMFIAAVVMLAVGTIVVGVVLGVTAVIAVETFEWIRG